MRYAGIDECDLCNGNDIGMSLYVQGCDAHCKNCFNPETWDFSGGKQWTKKEEDDFLKAIGRIYIKRISFLGGEPMAFQNVEIVARLTSTIKERYPTKSIWLYSGLKLEELEKRNDIYSIEILKNIDYLVDGRYVDELNDKTLPFRGSKNQRILTKDENGCWYQIGF